MAGLVGQTGFFPGDRRLRELDLLGDGLPLLDRLIPWERFRPILESVPKAKPKGPGGRKPYDRILLFKMMVLQQLHNLSDEQTEYQIRDRLSFQRFLGISLEEAVPDHTTLWLFRETLAQVQLTERLFTAFHGFLREAGYAARAGQIIDASFVTVPRQHMRRKEREQVNQGETPADWEEQPAKRRQKDTHARWTKKNGQSYFGYKNHINVDKRHKLIHQYVVTDASVHDSQCLEALLDTENTGGEVFADSAYRSEESEQLLQAQGYRNRIHERAYRNRPLTKAQERANTRRSRHRARVEHNAGSLKNDAQKKPRRCCIKERDGNVTYSDTISGRTGDSRDSDHHAVVRSRHQLRTRGNIAYSALIVAMAENSVQLRLPRHQSYLSAIRSGHRKILPASANGSFRLIAAIGTHRSDLAAYQRGLVWRGLDHVNCAAAHRQSRKSIGRLVCST